MTSLGSSFKLKPLHPIGSSGRQEKMRFEIDIKFYPDEKGKVKGNYIVCTKGPNRKTGKTCVEKV